MSSSHLVVAQVQDDVEVDDVEVEEEYVIVLFVDVHVVLTLGDDVLDVGVEDDVEADDVQVEDGDVEVPLVDVLVVLVVGDDVLDVDVDIDNVDVEATDINEEDVLQIL